MTVYQRIRNAIEESLKQGKRNFIIYPFGENGILTKQILNNAFGIAEEYLVDNVLAEYNPSIRKLDYFKNRNCDDKTVLFTCENPDSYNFLCCQLKRYFKENNIVNIFGEEGGEENVVTKCGKYSYGPLCNHYLVEEVGAFCSFATGSDVVENHPIHLLSTHCFLYADKRANSALNLEYEDWKWAPWYFEGVKPHGIAEKLRRITIGNDVWLGKNVTVTNGSNIGNGVIAAAGAVITKNVPDYAVVAGVPARIIRYRYTAEQISRLNQIAWWNWTDELIRERYEDFYLDIDDFLRKYSL